MKKSLQRLVGNVKRGFKTLIGLTLIVPTIAFASCREPAIAPAKAIIRIKVIAPETYVTTKFDNEGHVQYTVKGEDSEEPIEYIKTKIDEEESQNYPNNYEITTSLNQGWNYFSASAVTSGGTEDSTPATDAVYSPSEEEARTIIRNYLENANITYDESEDLSLGASDNAHADFLCYLGKDHVINYVSSMDDLTKDRENRALLNFYGIPNYSWIRTPEYVGKSGLENFVNGGS
ncbi:hypothetical protein KAJ87_00220 [Candidatus Pacearchaeota archaeon]|nr:hypothetical protein [Candidatus Pacearchaeota archaeon]